MEILFNNAIDSTENTIDFMINEIAGQASSKTVLLQIFKGRAQSGFCVINVDKNTAYPLAIDELKIKKSIKNLASYAKINNKKMGKQELNFIKKLVNQN